MLSRSPSPSSLFEDTPPMDEGFMVVPVWEPLAEVQIGSVVLEDPFLGFGRSTSPAATPHRKAFAVTTADAAFVGPASSPPTATHPLPPPTHPQAAAYLPYPPQPQCPPVPYTQQPQPQPVPYAPPQPQHTHHGSSAGAQLDKDLFAEPPEEGLGWWEEAGPVSAFDAVDGSAPDLLSHQNSVEHFLGYPQQEEVTIEASSEVVGSVGSEVSGPLKSPEDILNEIYAEANQLESEASERGDAQSPSESGWWEEESPAGTDSAAPSPLEAAFDETFQRDILQAVGGGAGQAVLSLDPGTLPADALTAGRQLNLVLHIKEPLTPSPAGASAARKRAGPKIRATVSIAPAPPSKKAKRSPSVGKSPAGAPKLKKGEAKERKKAQNRVAATKYREKKRSARDILLRELEVEEERRDRLRRQEEDAQNEIAYLRDLLKKVQNKKDQEVVI